LALTEAYRQLRAELHLGEPWYKGIGYGFTEYTAGLTGHFQNWANTTKGIMEGVEGSISSGMASIVESGVRGGEKRRR